MRRGMALCAALAAACGCSEPPSEHPDGGEDAQVPWCRHDGDLFCMSENIERRCTFLAGSEFPQVTERECLPLGLRHSGLPRPGRMEPVSSPTFDGERQLSPRN